MTKPVSSVWLRYVYNRTSSQQKLQQQKLQPANTALSKMADVTRHSQQGHGRSD